MGHFYPAVRAFRDFLTDEYEPVARPEPGLKTTAVGEAAYELAIRLQIMCLPWADEIHRFGLEAVEPIDAEMDELAGRLGHIDELALQQELAVVPRLWAADRQPVDHYLDPGNYPAKFQTYQ